jgi:hypothetical protein
LSRSPQDQRAEGAGGSGELVQAAYAANPVEAEMIQGLLANGGIPSLLQPAGLNGPRLGFGGLRPGFGGGSQRVMVRASGAEKARALLAETLVEDEEAAWPEIANARHLEGAGKPRGYGVVGAYARIFFWSFAALAVVFAVFVLLRAG